MPEDAGGKLLVVPLTFPETSPDSRVHIESQEGRSVVSHEQRRTSRQQPNDEAATTPSVELLQVFSRKLGISLQDDH